MRERTDRRHTNNQHSVQRRHSRVKEKPKKYLGFFNTLFRQIVFSAALLAILFGIKSIQNPSAKSLNSYLQSSFKYNIEYDWIISNINKTAEYILSMLTNNQ